MACHEVERISLTPLLKYQEAFSGFSKASCFSSNGCSYITWAPSPEHLGVIEKRSFGLQPSENCKPVSHVVRNASAVSREVHFSTAWHSEKLFHGNRANHDPTCVWNTTISTPPFHGVRPSHVYGRVLLRCLSVGYVQSRLKPFSRPSRLAPGKSGASGAGADARATRELPSTLRSLHQSKLHLPAFSKQARRRSKNGLRDPTDGGLAARDITRSDRSLVHDNWEYLRADPCVGGNRTPGTASKQLPRHDANAPQPLPHVTNGSGTFATLHVPRIRLWIRRSGAL